MISLNKEQRKIFDEMLDITEDKWLFLYMYGNAGTGNVSSQHYYTAPEFK